MVSPVLKKHAHIFLIGLGVLLLACSSWFINHHNARTTTDLVRQAEVKLHQKERLARARLQVLSGFLQTVPPDQVQGFYQGPLGELYSRDGIVILAYQNDSLCFWTDNHPAFELNAYTVKGNVQVIKLRNGWYEFIRYRDSHIPRLSLAALISIKHEFDIENQYLENSFVPWLGLPANTDLKTPVSYFPHAVRSVDGVPLFEVVNVDGLYHSKTGELVSFFCAGIAFVLFLVLVILAANAFIGDRNLFMLVVFCVVFATRFLMITMHWPEAFYDTLLFDPSKFADANSLFYSSLGDVLINSILLFIMSMIAYRSFDLKQFSKPLQVFLLLVFLLLLFYFAWHILLVLKSLVVNSTISYNVNELFGLSWYSIVAYASACMLLSAFYSFAEKVIISLMDDVSIGIMLALILAVSGGYSYVMIHYVGISFYETLWPCLYLLVAFLLRRFKASYNFINIGLLIVLGAGISSYLFSLYDKQNRLEKYRAISYKLSEKQDLIAESEFDRVSSSIRNDSKLKSFVSFLPLSAEPMEQRIRQSNFTGYFDRYDVVLNLFDEKCDYYFRQAYPEYQNQEYFQAQLDSAAVPTLSEDLFFIERKTQKQRYIAMLPLSDPAAPEKRYKLYIQLEPKQVSDMGSFPDLLMNSSLEKQLNPGNISYALYNNGKLISKYGNYNYTLFEGTDYTLNNTPGFMHYVFRNDLQNTVVITERKENAWDRFTTVSYVFVFFSLIVLVIILMNSMLVIRRYFIRSLNTRIQLILVLIVVFSLAGVVVGTVWVVSSQSGEKNKNDLLAKSQSVLMELRQNIGDESHLDPSHQDLIAYRLRKLATLFGSDISLYDTNGQLFATSQPVIYEQGIVSRFMNPIAYSAFRSRNLASYSLRENIGRLNYLSAYIPFYNNDDRLLGYLNLPYFARQKDLEKELTAYLTTLINIYTILFAVATLIALLVSNYLTKPLRLIKLQLSKIGLGKYNERLSWDTSDEIGELVKEYNKMLSKLEESSERLAKSERESAWREMAKQVAHEIKNPLTPMKLNIQHLQRVIETHPDDMKDRVHRVASMLIEQIDTLAHIANEFSNFAKLPRATIDKINISEVLSNITELFRQSEPADIELHVHKNISVNADKEQIMRVFTNLLKNASQAIPPDRPGHIIVSSVIESGTALISVRDNGIGISPLHRAKIFTPNFTTKSTGTGLGLAMVRNIITSFGGTIWFETSMNEGTTFFIRLPLAV